MHRIWLLTGSYSTQKRSKWMVVLVNCGEAAVSGAVVRGHPGQNNRALFTFLVLIRSVGEGATAGEYMQEQIPIQVEAKVPMQTQVQIQILNGCEG